MEIIFKTSYFKDLRKVPIYVREAAISAIDALSKASSLETAGLDITKMEGHEKGENYYRIRIGDYRIGIEWVKPNVYVICLLSRGAMYKKFPPP